MRERMRVSLNRARLERKRDLRASPLAYFQLGAPFLGFEFHNCVEIKGENM
jgi:hypothetical protein